MTIKTLSANVIQIRFENKKKDNIEDTARKTEIIADKIMKKVFIYYF